jgi:hypothetical protein
MARSDEAIRRRALKRQRTEEEQRAFDRNNKVEKKHKQQPKPVQTTVLDAPKDGHTNDDDEYDPLKEPGAWKCPGCGNGNFASRQWCNSKTCDERRPIHIPAPTSSATRTKRPIKDFKNHYEPNPFDEEGAWTCPSCQFQNFASRERCKGFQCNEKRPTGNGQSAANNGTSNSSRRLPRHDLETSKVVVWSKQADASTLNKNQQLRRKYQETNGEGMSVDDIERAKILIARDDRKRQKKLKDMTGEESTSRVEIKDESAKPTEDPATDEVVDLKVQRKLNKTLRRRYVATGGEGMSEDDIERAKVLIARDERKRQKQSN